MFLQHDTIEMCREQRNCWIRNRTQSRHREREAVDAATRASTSPAPGQLCLDVLLCHYTKSLLVHSGSNPCSKVREYYMLNGPRDPLSTSGVPRVMATTPATV